MGGFDDLSREELITLLDIYAKNWLAHDGCWFLALEEAYGIEAAIEMDKRSWERFTVAEAKRITRAFDLPGEGGLKALEQALNYRLYAGVNEQQSAWLDDNILEFRMINCRVQSARKRKGLPDFPCKPVGIVEYSGFASTIDSRISTTCVACPPDKVAGAYCIWHFKLAE